MHVDYDHGHVNNTTIATTTPITLIVCPLQVVVLSKADRPHYLYMSIYIHLSIRIPTPITMIVCPLQVVVLSKADLPHYLYRSIYIYI